MSGRAFCAAMRVAVWDGASCLEPDELGQPLRAASAGQDAQHDLGQRQASLGACRGDAVVAGQRELQSAAKAVAVDGRHFGLAAANVD